MRTRPSSLIALLLIVPLVAGCVAPDETGEEPQDPTPVSEPGPAPVLDGKAIVDHVDTFSKTYSKRNANGPHHQGARDYLAGEMEQLGYTVLRQEFTAPVSPGSTPTNVVTNDGTLVNVIGLKWGTDNDSWIVIGGHYDTTDLAVQGAYDDGSGTILTLELAKAFAEIETEKTIAFFMFDGEEQGLRGSFHFVETWADGSFTEEFGYDPDIFAMIDLDMFGINYPAEPPIYFDENSDVIRTFVDGSRKEIGIPDDKFRFQGISAGRSDYAPFEDAGIPTAFFISAFEEYYVGPHAMPEGETYPFWHRADTTETMVLMAGGERATLDAGFSTAARLTSELLHHLATTPGLDLDVRADG